MRVPTLTLLLIVEFWASYFPPCASVSLSIKWGFSSSTSYEDQGASGTWSTGYSHVLQLGKDGQTWGSGRPPGTVTEGGGWGGKDLGVSSRFSLW